MRKIAGHSFSVPLSWLVLVLSSVLISSFISPCDAFATEKGPEKLGLLQEIEISGSTKFKNQVRKALELLKKKNSEAYDTVSQYVGTIEQGKHSGMWAYRNPPTYEMADRTTFYSVTWCAGSIAHDSFHSKLYHDYKKQHSGAVPDNVWVGEDAEKKCIRHQLNVLKKIGAPRHEIDHCRKQKGTHHDVNKDGKYDWSDYEKRDW